jgi:hypothetical protein
MNYSKKKKGCVNMSERKKFKEIIQERLQTAELYAGVVEKMELWKGYYCLLTDQERAIARAYGYNIECSNCATKEQCDTYIR